MRIDAYLVSQGLDTKALGAFLGIAPGVDGSLVIGDTALEGILKIPLAGPMAVLYPFGAVATADCDSVAVRGILQFVESMGNKVDEAWFARYADTYTVEPLSPGEGPDWLAGIDGARVPGDPGDYALTTCATMAASLLYEWLDDRADALTDRGEALVVKAGRGKPFRIQSHLADVSAFLRFMADLALATSNGRPGVRAPGGREYGIRLGDVYEMRERLDILLMKGNNLRTIMKALAEQSYRRQELRVIAIQALLILSFLFLDLIHFIDWN